MRLLMQRDRLPAIGVGGALDARAQGHASEFATSIVRLLHHAVGGITILKNAHAVDGAQVQYQSMWHADRLAMRSSSGL